MNKIWPKRRLQIKRFFQKLSAILRDKEVLVDHIVLFYLCWNKSRANIFTTCNEYLYFTGVPHGEDLFYLFGIPFIGHPRQKYYEIDKEVSKLTMTMWSNYVKYGYVDINWKIYWNNV